MKTYNRKGKDLDSNKLVEDGLLLQVRAILLTHRKEEICIALREFIV